MGRTVNKGAAVKMPMSRVGNERGDAFCGYRRDRDAGFTLIEVMAVIAILAVVIGVVIVRIPASRGTAELASLSHTIASELRNARADAMSAGSERTVVFDTSAHKVLSEQRGRTIEIAPDITLHATAAASERRSGSQVAIRFFANGSSTGGALKLERGQKAHEVRINWLSGRVIVVSP